MCKLLRRVGVAHAPVRYASFVSLFTGAKEAKFPYFTKEKSPLGLYRNPPTFFFTNPRFVLLICDWCFVLLSLICASTLVTNHRHMHDAYILHPEWLARMTVSRSEKKSVDNVLNVDIFLAKTHGFPTRGPYSPPESL